MSYLPNDIQTALDQARENLTRVSHSLTLRAGGRAYPVLRLVEDGVAVSLGEAPHLGGLVDLYDGDQHVSQCLITASRDEGAVRIFEFKRVTAVANAPAIDYERAAFQPAGLLTHA